MYTPTSQPDRPPDRFRRARVAWVVTCARCGQDWPEDAEGVRWRDGDYWCRYEQDCDDRMAGV